MKRPLQRSSRAPLLAVAAFVPLVACSDRQMEDPSLKGLGRSTMSVSWSPAGGMLYARVRHTATLLLNGKVLLTGGALETVVESELPLPSGTFASPLQTAELYDPNTGAFEAASLMLHARWGHTATLLRDGTVLIVGGFDRTGVLMDAEHGRAIQSAELYDPARKTFTERRRSAILRSSAA